MKCLPQASGPGIRASHLIPRGSFTVTSIRSSGALALLLSVTALPAPLAAAPASAPTRYFTGSDLFNLEVATDPQISPDGRTIAYVRKSYDVMTDNARNTIWLVDVASG